MPTFKAWKDIASYMNARSRIHKRSGAIWPNVRWNGFKSGTRSWTGRIRHSRNGLQAGRRTSPITALTDMLNGERKDKAAIIFEGEPGDQRVITFAELHQQVCRFANVLKARGLKAGDRSIIYMPMIPEAAVAMLACARLGVIHSVVFGGFSAEALKARIQDLDARIVITADGGWRRGKEVRLKTAVDEALEGCPNVHNVIVYQRTGTGRR